MRIAAVCLMVVLTCSCHEGVDNPTPELPEATAERQEEVYKIIRNYTGRGLDIVRGPLSIQEVEKELDDRIRRSYPDQPEGAPTRTLRGPDWEQLKDKYKPGDEFYYYTTDLESWGLLLGSEGYVLLRGSELVGIFGIAMN